MLFVIESKGILDHVLGSGVQNMVCADLEMSSTQIWLYHKKNHFSALASCVLRHLFGGDCRAHNAMKHEKSTGVLKANMSPLGHYNVQHLKDLEGYTTCEGISAGER